MALLALCPYIVLSSATLLFDDQVVQDLGASSFGGGLADALANAGYAFGAVAAADLLQRLPKRRLFLVNELVFAAGSVLCALSPGIVEYVAGRVLQGAATGVLLVVALPPLVTTHGPRRLPLTAAFVNLGLFGMVTAGPLVGGIVADAAAWRPFFLVLAVLGILGWVLGLLTFEPDAPAAPGAGFDFSALPVALLATVLPFLGVAWLARGSFTAAGFLVPLIAGLAALATLLVRQYRKDKALMPLKLLAHTLPVTGIAVAMVAGAAFTAVVELCATYLLTARGLSPLQTGALLATQIPGVVLAAWLFKRMFSTRWLPVVAFSGLALVGLAGALVLVLIPGHAVVLTAVAGFLLGFGAGAGVSPGLFMAGLSVPSKRLGPTFALVELLRSEAAFLVAPVLLAVSQAVASPATGIHIGALVVVLLAGGGGAALLLLLLVGGMKPHRPDLERWLGGEDPAFDSRPLAAAVRDV
jgi:MFS family permease